MTEAADSRQRNRDVRFEPRDWPPRLIGFIAIGILAFLVITPFVLIAAFPRALPDVDRSLHVAPPAPQLQTHAAADLARFRSAEETKLNTYYWIDKQKGIVHIPIEQAMKNLARSGIAGFPKATP